MSFFPPLAHQLKVENLTKSQISFYECVISEEVFWGGKKAVNY